MSFETFIARRIHGTSPGEERRVSHTAIQIAVAGIAVGLATMVVSLAVVRGFKQEVSGKARGFLADVQIRSLSQDRDFNILPLMADDSLLDVVRRTRGVAHVQKFATKSGMLKTDADFAALEFKGVGEDYDTMFLRQYLVEGRLPRFSASKASGEILLSARQSGDLRLRVGDKVFAYFFSGLRSADDGDALSGASSYAQSLRARRFTVVGIYETHLAEYDRVFCFTDLHTVRRLSNWEEPACTGLEIHTGEGSDREEVTYRLVGKVNHSLGSNGARRGAFSIRELSPRIFAWLDVLDTNVVMIVVLMLVIGSFTVMSSLLIVMLERIHTIAVLKALGATDGQVRGVFQRFSLYVVGKAVVIGDAVAVAVCLLQQEFNVVPLDAQTYYIDHVPISVSWTAFLLVNAGVLFISLLVIMGGSRLMSLGAPARTLTWE